MYAERELPVFTLSKIWRQNSTVAIRTIVPFSMQRRQDRNKITLAVCFDLLIPVHLNYKIALVDNNHTFKCGGMKGMREMVKQW